MTRFRKCSCTWLVVAVAAVLCLGGVRAADDLKLKPAPQAVSSAEDPGAGDYLYVVPSNKPLKRIVLGGSTESSADGATNYHAERIGATVSSCRGVYGDNAILDAGSNPNPLTIESAEFTVESTSFAFCAVPGGSTVCSDTDAVCNSAADCPTGVCSNKNVDLHLTFYDTYQKVVNSAPGINPLRTYVFSNLNDPATCGPDCLAAESANQDGIATYLFLFDLASADVCFDEAGLPEPCTSLNLTAGGPSDDPTPYHCSNDTTITCAGPGDTVPCSGNACIEDREVFVQWEYRNSVLPVPARTDPVDIDITVRFSTNPPGVGGSDIYVWRNQDFSANGLELDAGAQPDGGCLNGTCDRRNLGGAPADWMLHLRGLPNPNVADAGTDFWITPPLHPPNGTGEPGKNTFKIFEGTTPTPDFFDYDANTQLSCAENRPGCSISPCPADPFTGTVYFGGIPVLTDAPGLIGPTDTFVGRLSPADLPGPNSSDTVPIQILALNLLSTGPVTITRNGGEVSEDWDFQVCLSDSAQAVGSMEITKNACEAGGTFTASLPVLPKLIMGRRDPANPGAYDCISIYDFGIQGQGSVVFASSGYWLNRTPPELNLVDDPTGFTFWDGNCDGFADDQNGDGETDLLPSTNPTFKAGVREFRCPDDSSCDPTTARKVLTEEQSALAAHGVLTSQYDCPDPDADGICSDGDDCPTFFDPQQDTPDTDGDGFADPCDNCPQDCNPGQEDLDGDGEGDACEGCRTDAECDDGDVCTTDTCDVLSGICTNAPCDDGNACNGVETCDPTTGCQPGTPPDCDDGNVCNGAETCDPASGCQPGTPAPNGTPCDDANACTNPDTCLDGACVGGGDAPDCNDGNNCTIDRCDPVAGCTHECKPRCRKRPKTVAYYKHLCDRHDRNHPHDGEFISQTDVDCVNDSCTFSDVDTVAELCEELRAPGHPHGPTTGPINSRCERAEAQFAALLLNVCRCRLDDSNATRASCGQGPSTVGATKAEIDALLCNPNRTHSDCGRAECKARRINNGSALNRHSLHLEKASVNTRLSWSIPYDPVADGSVANSGDGGEPPPEETPTGYIVWRRTDSEAPWTQVGYTTDLAWTDETATDGVFYQYEIGLVFLGDIPDEP